LAFWVAYTLVYPRNAFPFDSVFNGETISRYFVPVDGCVYFTSKYEDAGFGIGASKAYMGFYFKDLKGQSGAYMVDHFKLPAVNGSCEPVSDCISHPTYKMCVDPSSDTTFTWRTPDTPSCGRNGTSWLPAGLAYGPPRPDGRQTRQFNGTTFMISISNEDQAVPLD
jgi:hypothetical protein